MPDLRQVFRELVRFATELRNAVVDRLMSPFGVPWAYLEPMWVMDRPRSRAPSRPSPVWAP